MFARLLACLLAITHVSSMPYAPHWDSLMYASILFSRRLSTLLRLVHTHTHTHTFQCVPADVLEFSRITATRRRRKERERKWNPSRRLTLTIKSSVYYKSLINVIRNLEHNNLIYKVAGGDNDTITSSSSTAGGGGCVELSSGIRIFVSIHSKHKSNFACRDSTSF